MIYVDLEMNSLEDAYVNIAKAEERLHNEEHVEMEEAEDVRLSEYLRMKGSPDLWQQVWAIVMRRLRQFGRDPK